MTVSIRLVGCAKSFGRQRILEPIDLEIAAGETIVLLGPSGCGKTTTLRLIAGLEQPNPGGRVLFGGREVTALPIERRNVGMVFQSYALFPNMSVAGNVEYGLKVRGMASGARARRVTEMLEMMRIAELAGRRIDQLSGGQRQRVALARALAVRPDVLLLDEPLTALDAKLREALRTEIDALLRSVGITSVYVTHDQTEAMALGDRIAVMERGRIAQIGTAREIWCQPKDRFVAGFIGLANRLTGRISGGLLELGGARLPWPGEDGEVDVIFRPDAARIGPANGALSGHVRSAQFLGDRTRLAIVMQDGYEVTIDQPPSTGLRMGDAVGLALDPSLVTIFPKASP